ncbi:MAG: hypothetical protein E7586_06345 [Ruminococcaceae bacterium]|nr:hypothetical protein [Oscillospiraceae bacterium]
MKRIFAFLIVLIMILSSMTACNKNDDDSNGVSTYITEKDGDYILTLPKSQEKRRLTEEQERFVPYITDKLVEKAEKKIIREFKDDDTPKFLLIISEDYLCLYAELIKNKPLAGIFGGFDHEHCIFKERISSQPVKPETNDVISNDESSQSSEATTNNESNQTDNGIETILSGSDLLRQETIDSIVFTKFPSNVSHSFYGESIQKIRDYLSDFSFVPDDLSIKEIPIGGGFTITVNYADDKTETINFLCNFTHITVKDTMYRVNSHSEINIDEFFENLKNTSQNDESSEDESSNGEKSPEPQYNGLKIISGDQEIIPFSCLMWAKIDYGNGTITEMCVDKISVEDVISGKTSTSVTEIPTVYLHNTITNRVQTNGELVITHLWTEGDNGYTQREITFNDIAYLDKGVYFVSAEVLLNGNCDADAPQGYYRYEHIFRLVVEKNPFEYEIKISIPDGSYSQKLKESEMKLIFDILNNETEWLYGTPDCLWVANFKSDFRDLNYCSCGTLIDTINYRSRKLTDEEKESLESLISVYDNDMSNSGYTVGFDMYQYTWDGWGISTKEIDSCDVGYKIIDALKLMKETGEILPKISDEVFEIGSGEYPVERGTMWIECENKIYRLTPDLSQICLVETHFGEGKVLEITDDFITDVYNAWHYAPYDYYKGVYDKGDKSMELSKIFTSGSSVQLNIKDIHIENTDNPKNTITVELTSAVDQTVTVNLDCQQSNDNLAGGDRKTVELQKGVPTTVELSFGGWKNTRYSVYLQVDFTAAEIIINP